MKKKKARSGSDGESPAPSAPKKARPLGAGAEATRERILQAAERVLSVHNPDAVGLAEIAREAGVSHALVSHYFGTYVALIEATVKRRIATTRERLAKGVLEGSATGGFRGLLQGLARAADDAPTLRMLAWAMLSGKMKGPGGRARDLELLVDAMGFLWSAHAGRAVSRRDLEFSLLVVLFLVYGYAVGKDAMLPALGQEPSEEANAEWIDRIVNLVDAYLRTRPAPEA